MVSINSSLCSFPSQQVPRGHQKTVRTIEITYLLKFPGVSRRLEKLGFIERDMDNYYLALDESQDDLDELSGYSTTYRIAVGPNQGRKVFT